MLRLARPKNQNLVAHLRELVAHVEADDHRGDAAGERRRRARVRAEARGEQRPRSAAEDHAEAHGEEHQDPGDRGHGVALVLPAHLAVQRHQREPAERAHPEEDAPARRVRSARSGTSATAGTSQPQGRPPSAKWCSVLRRTTYLSRKRYSSHFSRGGHVRVVERELGDGAVGRPLAGEERGWRAPARATASAPGTPDARQRGDAPARAPRRAPARRTRGEHAERRHADHRLGPRREEQRARAAREPAAQARREASAPPRRRGRRPSVAASVRPHTPRWKAFSMPLKSDQSSAPSERTAGGRRYLAQRPSGSVRRAAAEEEAERGDAGDDGRPEHDREPAEAEPGSPSARTKG